MKTFKWKLDTESIKEDIKVTDSQLFINLLHAGSSTAYKDGMGRDLLRRLYKACDKIENDKTGSVDLEDAEFELIKDIFDRAKWDSRNMNLICQVYDSIEAVK